MRLLLLVLLFFSVLDGLSAQYVYTIKADSVRLTGPDSSELIIGNHTQGVPGVLFNTGNGRTAFKKALIQLDDTTYLIGVDTLHTMRGGYWAPNGTAIYNTNPGNVGINQPNPATTLDVGGPINVTDTGHYDIGGQSVLQDSVGILQVGIGSGSSAGYGSNHYNTLIGEGAGSISTINGSTVSVGTYAGSSASGQENTSLGAQAGNSAQGDFNVFGGYSAGTASSGSANTYLGGSAGFSSTGDYNTAAGYNSAFILQGTDNSIFGENAGSQLVGNANVCVGSNAGSGARGNANTYVGYSAAAAGVSGSNNVSIGNYTSWNVGTGSHNLYGGDSVGGANVGNFNTYLGAWAGNPPPDTTVMSRRVRSLFTPDNEFTGVTLLGGKTVANNTSLSDATAVGYQAAVSTSNTMVFGDSAVTTWLFNSKAPAVSGAALVVGDNFTNGDAAYLSTGGVWTNASDRNKKENFQLLNQTDLLAKIDELPVSRWNYKGLPGEHIGPVAQDFHRIFDVGSNDKTISTIDPSGIALAGIQGLLRQIKDQQKQIYALTAILRQAKEKLNALTQSQTIKTSLQ